MKTRLTLMLLTLTGLMILAGQVRGVSSAAVVNDHVNPHYKGGSTFNLASAGPNVARCGAFPQNIELTFTGGGIDTEGGLNTAVFSACTNTETNLVSDLEATDTYVQTGDQVFIEGDPFVLAPNPAICAAAAPRPLRTSRSTSRESASMLVGCATYAARNRR